MSEDLTDHLGKEIIKKIAKELCDKGIFTATMNSNWGFYSPVAEVSGRISEDEMILTDHLTLPGTIFVKLKLADPEVFEKIVKLVVEKREQWDRDER